MLHLFDLSVRPLLAVVGAASFFVAAAALLPTPAVAAIPATLPAIFFLPAAAAVVALVTIVVPLLVLDELDELLAARVRGWRDAGTGGGGIAFLTRRLPLEPVVAVEAVEEAVVGLLAATPRVVDFRLVVEEFVMLVRVELASDTVDGALRGEAGLARYDFGGDESPEDDEGCPLTGDRGRVRELWDFGDRT